MRTYDTNTFQAAQRMYGRPVGFNLRMGVGWGLNGVYPNGYVMGWGTLYGVDVPEPVAFQIIFNSCNCPASYFLGTQNPSDMTIYLAS